MAAFEVVQASIRNWEPLDDVAGGEAMGVYLQVGVQYPNKWTCSLGQALRCPWGASHSEKPIRKKTPAVEEQREMQWREYNKDNFLVALLSFTDVPCHHRRRKAQQAYLVVDVYRKRMVAADDLGVATAGDAGGSDAESERVSESGDAAGLVCQFRTELRPGAWGRQTIRLGGHAASSDGGDAPPPADMESAATAGDSVREAKSMSDSMTPTAAEAPRVPELTLDLRPLSTRPFSLSCARPRDYFPSIEELYRERVNDDHARRSQASYASSNVAGHVTTHITSPESYSRAQERMSFLRTSWRMSMAAPMRASSSHGGGSSAALNRADSLRHVEGRASELRLSGMHQQHSSAHGSLLGSMPGSMLGSAPLTYGRPSAASIGGARKTKGGFIGEETPNFWRRSLMSVTASMANTSVRIIGHQLEEELEHSTWLPADWKDLWTSSWPEDDEDLPDRQKPDVVQLMETEFRKDCIILFNTIFPRVHGKAFQMLRDAALNPKSVHHFKRVNEFNSQRRQSVLALNWRGTAAEGEEAQEPQETEEPGPQASVVEQRRSTGGSVQGATGATSALSGPALALMDFARSTQMQDDPTLSEVQFLAEAPCEFYVNTDAPKSRMQRTQTAGFPVRHPPGRHSPGRRFGTDPPVVAALEDPPVDSACSSFALSYFSKETPSTCTGIGNFASSMTLSEMASPIRYPPNLDAVPEGVIERSMDGGSFQEGTGSYEGDVLMSLDSRVSFAVTRFASGRGLGGASEALGDEESMRAANAASDDQVSAASTMRFQPGGLGRQYPAVNVIHSDQGSFCDDYSPRIMFLKRLVICFATCGVFYNEVSNSQQLGELWPYPLAALLGHGSRILIRLEDVDSSEFLNFLLTGRPRGIDWRESGVPWPLRSRIAATHSVQIDPATGVLNERKLRVTNAADSIQNIADGVRKKHLCLNVPIGGVGNPSALAGHEALIDWTGRVLQKRVRTKKEGPKRGGSVVASAFGRASAVFANSESSGHRGSLDSTVSVSIKSVPSANKDDDEEDARLRRTSFFGSAAPPSVPRSRKEFIGKQGMGDGAKVYLQCVNRFGAHGQNLHFRSDGAVDGCGYTGEDSVWTVLCEAGHPAEDGVPFKLFARVRGVRRYLRATDEGAGIDCWGTGGRECLFVVVDESDEEAIGLRSAIWPHCQLGIGGDGEPMEPATVRGTAGGFRVVAAVEESSLLQTVNGIQGGHLYIRVDEFGLHRSTASWLGVDEEASSTDPRFNMKGALLHAKPKDGVELAHAGLLRSLAVQRNPAGDLFFLSRIPLGRWSREYWDKQAEEVEEDGAPSDHPVPAPLLRMRSEPSLLPRGEEASMVDIHWFNSVIKTQSGYILDTPPSAQALQLVLAHFDPVNANLFGKGSFKSVQDLYDELLTEESSLVKRSGGVLRRVEPVLLQLTFRGHILMLSHVHLKSHRGDYTIRKNAMLGTRLLRDEDWRSALGRAVEQDLNLSQDTFTDALESMAYDDELCHTVREANSLSASYPGIKSKYRTHLVCWEICDIAIFKEHGLPIDLERRARNPYKCDFITTRQKGAETKKMFWRWVPVDEAKALQRFVNHGEVTVDEHWARAASKREGAVDFPPSEAALAALMERCGVSVAAFGGPGRRTLSQLWVELGRQDCYLRIKGGRLLRVVERLVLKLQWPYRGGRQVLVQVMHERPSGEVKHTRKLVRKHKHREETWDAAAQRCLTEDLQITRQQVKAMLQEKVGGASAYGNYKEYVDTPYYPGLQTLSWSHLATYTLREDVINTPHGRALLGLDADVANKAILKRVLPTGPKTSATGSPTGDSNRDLERVMERSQTPMSAGRMLRRAQTSTGMEDEGIPGQRYQTCVVTAQGIRRRDFVWTDEHELDGVKGADLWDSAARSVEYRNVSSVLLGLEGTAPNMKSPFGVTHDASGASSKISAFGNRKWSAYRESHALQVPSGEGGMRVRIGRATFEDLVDLCDSLDLVDPCLDLCTEQCVFPRDVLERRYAEKEFFKEIIAGNGREARAAVERVRRRCAAQRGGRPPPLRTSAAESIKEVTHRLSKERMSTALGAFLRASGD